MYRKIEKIRRVDKNDSLLFCYGFEEVREGQKLVLFVPFKIIQNDAGCK